MTLGTVRVAGYDVVYADAGTEGPVLPARLLVHNALSSHVIWEHAMPFLAQQTRCLAPDLPGHGDSSALSPTGPVPDMPAILDAFLDELAIARADLIGASRGGGFALAMAARFPERVRRLVLVGATGMPQRLVPMGTLRARYDELVSDQALAEIVRDRFAEIAQRSVTYERLRGAAQKTADRTSGLLPFAARIQADTLLVWGVHDKHAPVAWGRELVQTIPRARLVVMRDVAHLPHYEAPQQFAGLVNEFLAS